MGCREQYLQWSWSLGCKNVRIYNDFDACESKTTAFTMILKPVMQKRQYLQWFWSLGCKNNSISQPPYRLGFRFQLPHRAPPPPSPPPYCSLYIYPRPPAPLPDWHFTLVKLKFVKNHDGKTQQNENLQNEFDVKTDTRGPILKKRCGGVNQYFFKTQTAAEWHP